MLLDVAIYGLDRGSLMLASPFDYLLHTIAGYFAFFQTAHLDNVVVEWVLDVSLFKRETCAMLSYFVPRD
jgi:hypothetical protein